MALADEKRNSPGSQGRQGVENLLTRPVYLAAMAFTAAQHDELASTYERLATDHMIPPEKKAEFGRKASWYRVLAKLAAKSEQTHNKKPR